MKTSVKYEVLKALVRAIGPKKRWNGNVEELLENRRKANAKNKIPELHDPDFEIGQITVCGCPVVTMKHKKGSDKANLFIIGGGMISAPRPASVKKAMRFAKETGLDLYVPYYPLCTDYPLTRAYEMIHATYRKCFGITLPRTSPFWGHPPAAILRWGWCRISMKAHRIPPCRGTS